LNTRLNHKAYFMLVLIQAISGLLSVFIDLGRVGVSQCHIGAAGGVCAIVQHRRGGADGNAFARAGSLSAWVRIAFPSPCRRVPDYAGMPARVSARWIDAMLVPYSLANARMLTPALRLSAISAC
jgi:hypothetical protein